MDVIKSILQSKQYKNIVTINKIKKEINEIFEEFLGVALTYDDMMILKNRLLSKVRELDNLNNSYWDKCWNKLMVDATHPGQRGQERIYTTINGSYVPPASNIGLDELTVSSRTATISASDLAISADRIREGTIATDRIDSSSTGDRMIARLLDVNTGNTVFEADLPTMPTTTYGLRGSRSRSNRE